MENPSAEADANPANRRARARVSRRQRASLQRIHAGARGAALRAADTVVPADRVFSAAEAKGGSAIDEPREPPQGKRHRDLGAFGIPHQLLCRVLDENGL